jgi:choice-of-anchor A domain-containing protein
MIVNLDKANVYTIGNFTKNAAHNLSIEGAVNCNGNFSVALGTNTITSQDSQSSYSISCNGNVTLANGVSNKDIYYSGSSSIAATWNTEQYEVINFNNLPGFQESHDLIGYLKYLLTLPANSSSSFATGTYTLNGSYTKSINTFDCDPSSVQSTTTLRLGTKTNSDSLIKINDAGGTLTLNGLTVTANCTASDIIFAIDAATIIIEDCIILGTIYAPNSNIIITNSIINGAIYANSITVTGNATITNRLFNGYISQPVTPTLTVSPLSAIDNYTPIDVTITNVDGSIPSYYEIRYTLDAKDPTRNSTLYTGAFEVYSVGVVTVKAMLFGDGVPDGTIASQAYGFKCKTNTPVLTTSVVSGLTTYTITHDAGTTVYYTLDGSDPSTYAKPYDYTSFNQALKEEGAYTIRFFAYQEGCDASDLAQEDIIVALPITGLQPPKLSVWLVDDPSLGNLANKVTKVYDIPASPLMGLVNIPGSFTYSDVSRLAIYMDKNSSGDASLVRYTIDNSDPVSGVEYTYNTPIYLTKISFNNLRAFSHIDYQQYSNQLKHSFNISVTGSKVFDTSSNELLSDEVLDALQTGSSYAIDMAWVGPGVVTDDFAVYQALINILATEMFERIFNPTFGVSISNKLAEVNLDMNQTKIISDLKAEIEAQDPRISINEDLCGAYFDDDIGALVVDLVWTNLVTKNAASVKYAYDLDTVL